MIAQVHSAKVTVTNETENNNETIDDSADLQVDLLSGSYENIPIIENNSEEQKTILFDDTIDIKITTIDNGK